MHNLILPDKHYLLSVSMQIHEICKPIFQRFGITIFVFGKYFNDGSSYMLTNCASWLSHHLKHGYLSPAPLSTELLQKAEAFNIVLDTPEFHQAKHDLLHIFNSDQAIDLIYKNEDSYDVYCFAFPPNIHDGPNIFFNNLDEFRNFCSYFKFAAKNILLQAEKNKIFMPPEMRGIVHNHPTHKNNITLVNKEIEKPISIKKIYFTTKQGKIKFSARELQCINYILRGNTAKEIAKILNLSPRTIETYIDNIKRKCNCNTKSELIRYFLTEE